jgi:hypothetical protein
MSKQKAAPTLPVTRQSAKKSYEHYSKIHQNYQYSGKIKKRYPHSDGSINLSKPCQYCGYQHGLIIIRDQDDKGYCRCGRCDSPLFSLNERSQKQGLQHIGAILDGYLPDGEVRK